MKRRFIWIFYEIKWKLIKIFHMKEPYTVTYGKYQKHSGEEGNERLGQLLHECSPFAYCRFSYGEHGILVDYKREEYFGIKRYSQEILDAYASGEEGEKDLRKFYELMCNSINHATMIGVWESIPMGDAFINTFCNLDRIYFADSKSCEPYYYDYEEPWSKELEGKRVLVISPFFKEIQAQYEKRTLLWENPNVLPQFELQTLDSVWWWSKGRDARFSDWFEALDFLYREAMGKSWDVALLGCGPFGFPLASMLYQAGRSAIHMGGALQLLFGIKGARWDDNLGKKYYNEYWIRPNESSKPNNSEKLENNCYW